MAKLTFPPFPQSLKNWTPKDCQLNHFAIRSFRDVADADYIAASSRIEAAAGSILMG